MPSMTPMGILYLCTLSDEVSGTIKQTLGPNDVIIKTGLANLSPFPDSSFPIFSPAVHHQTSHGLYVLSSYVLISLFKLLHLSNSFSIVSKSISQETVLPFSLTFLY